MSWRKDGKEGTFDNRAWDNLKLDVENKMVDKNAKRKQGMVVRSCNPSNWGMDAEISGVQGWP